MAKYNDLGIVTLLKIGKPNATKHPERMKAQRLSSDECRKSTIASQWLLEKNRLII